MGLAEIAGNGSVYSSSLMRYLSSMEEYTTEAVIEIKSRALWVWSAVLRLITAGTVLLYLPWQGNSLQWGQEGATVAWIYATGPLWLNSSHPWDIDFFSPHSEATSLLFLPTK